MKDKKVLLSIIIPVYNLERYIGECLKKVLMNDISFEYEIIVIDDGSTDNSISIYREIERTHNSNVRCYYKNNGGLSSARNLGINKSNGKYIMFVDGDDWAQNINGLKNIIETDNYDVIQYKMVYYYSKKNKYVKGKPLTDNNSQNYYEIISDKVRKNELSISPCDKIVRKEFIIKNNLYFNDDLLCEDIDWSIRLYLCKPIIKTVNEDIYIYRQNRIGSITNINSKKRADSLLYIVRKWMSYEYEDEYLGDAIKNYMAFQYLVLLTIVNEDNCDSKTKNEIFNMKRILEYDSNKIVKLCRNVSRVVGIRNLEKLLKIYIYLQNKGKLVLIK